MTKLNWERQNSIQRYFKSLYERDAKGEESSKSTDSIDILNERHNPLGLSDADCTGKIPSPEKRLAIFKYLVENDKNLRDRYRTDLNNISDRQTISSKEFKNFSRHVLFASLNWPGDKCPPGIALPVAVCFSVIYLQIYNEHTAPGSRVSALTPEVYKELGKILKVRSDTF